MASRSSCWRPTGSNARAENAARADSGAGSRRQRAGRAAESYASARSLCAWASRARFAAVSSDDIPLRTAASSSAWRAARNSAWAARTRAFAGEAEASAVYGSPVCTLAGAPETPETENVPPSTPFFPSFLSRATSARVLGRADMELEARPTGAGGVGACADAPGPCRQRLELHFGPAENSRRRRAGKEARKKGRRRRNVLGLGRFRSTRQRAYRRAVYGGRLGLASERPRARRPGRVAGGTPGAGRRGGAQGNVVRRHGSEASATRPGAKGPRRRIRFRGAARALTTGAGARVRAGGVLSASV